jgi:hypothetical protein
MMAWTESHQSLLTHRKTIQAASALRVDRFKLIGHLHALWWWALDNLSSGGSTDGISDEVLAAAAWWDGDTDLIGVLREVGFLDDDGLHNWDLYGGKMEEKRRVDRERKRANRASSPVRWTSNGTPMEVAGRVEKSRGQDNNSSLDTDPVTPSKKINTNTAREKQITPEFLNELRQRFSDRDFDYEYEKWESYCAVKPPKVYKNSLRNWLERSPTVVAAPSPTWFQERYERHK